MSAIGEWFERFRASSSSGLAREADRPRPEATLTKHAGRLMRMKGVLSVGIGRTDDGRPAILLGLDNESPEVLASLPKTLDGVPVVHNTTGRINAL